jgi:hypothetical protein
MIVDWNAKAFILPTVFVKILKRSMVRLLSYLDFLLIVEEFSLEGVDCVGVDMIG